MLKSSLCDYSDAYILVKGTLSVVLVPTPALNPNNNNEEVVFKNCAPFTDCMNEINNMRIYNAKVIDVEMSMYNLIDYSNNYPKTSGSW